MAINTNILVYHLNMGTYELDHLLTLASRGAQLPELLRRVSTHLRSRGIEFLSVRFVHAAHPVLILAYTFGRRVPGLHRGYRDAMPPVIKRHWVNLQGTVASSGTFLHALHTVNLNHVLTLPLMRDNRVLGTVDLASSTPQSSSKLKKDWLEGAVALLALVHEHGQLVGRTIADREVKSRLRQENLKLREVAAQTAALPELVGQSPVWRRLISQIERVAPTDSTVLIRGETGTGKELIARAVHRLSKRAAKPFIAVNCGAFSRELISSELFGHERGAFTGAHERRLGRFCLAQGGTLFLDEIAELPPDVQVRLLRALQEREYERVGGTQTLRSDVRVVAATHRDMDAERTAGRFRDDLFYRLNVFPLFVPSLRERREDIVLLLRHFLHKAANKFGKVFQSIHSASLIACENYDWPGNVRELENLVEREVILSESGIFSLDPMADAMRDVRSNASSALDAVISAHIRKTLRFTHGKIYGSDGAANLLGLKPSTLQAKMRKYGIQRHEPTSLTSP